MKPTSKFFPWILTIIVVALIAGRQAGSKVRIESNFNYDAFSQVLVSGGGRVKPIDTVARTSLLFLSSRQTVEYDGQKQPPSRWIIDLMTGTKFDEKTQRIDFEGEVHNAEIFRIDHPEVLSIFGWKQEDGKRFSFAEMMKHSEAFDTQMRLASKVPRNQRTAYHNHLSKLSEKLKVYTDLMQLRSPWVVPPAPAGHDLGETGDDWISLEKAAAFSRTGKAHPHAQSFAKIVQAYDEKDASVFNKAVTTYNETLAKQFETETGQSKAELFFNNTEPFYQCSQLYVVALLLSLVSWFFWGGGACEGFRKAAFVLIVFTLGIHTFGLIGRIYIQGRPPVTNLYSSAIFIGWGCSLIAVILEYIYRNGFGNVTASVGGLITGIIAHHLILTSTRAGDTMEMMQAVLDTNFWLATHVVAVTIGYTATYLAGILAMLYVILGVFTPVMGQKVAAPESEPKRKVELLHKTVGRMIYGSICFAVMMSFIGTVLGGIWADQSWGRFWGWDPKENGALIIVIWNALILHARWGGMVRERGIAVLAIIGNIVTSWSWFGVNELGAGLHSYGFTDGTVFWLLVFVATQLHLMGMGLIPIGAWRSFTAPSGDNTASESPIATDDRPLPLTIMAYLNVGYSTILAICLIVLYSNPTINSAPRWFLVYLTFGYLFSAGLLYFTTVGLLNRQWRLGFVCGNLAAVFLVSNLLYLELKFNVGGMLLIAPLLLYPIALIFMLNFNYGKVGPGGPNQVDPATA